MPEEPPDGRSGGSAFEPLLPYFLAMFAACLIAGSFGGLRAYSGAALSLALAFFIADFSVRLLFSFGGTRARALSVFLRCAGVFFAFGWYFFFRIPADPCGDFAPRDCVLEARIDSVSRGANNSRYGMATIALAPEFLPAARGFKMWYTVSDGKRGSGESPDLRVSQIVRFDGVLSPSDPPQTLSRGRSSDPEGRAAFDKYLRSRFIYFKMFSRSAGARIEKPADGICDFYAETRAYMERSLSEFFDPKTADGEAARTYRAMILGDKSLLAKEQKLSFAQTGTMHIFAISGLHVGYAAAALFGILALLRVNWRIRPFFALPFLYVYVCACGARPSAMRAFAMITVFWLAASLMRGSKPFSALILAACVSLAVSPDCVFDAGFALSYAVAASIFLYALPLHSALERRAWIAGRTLAGRAAAYSLKYLLAAFCISLGALFAGAPLCAHYFSLVAPMSLLYSPFFVALAGIAAALGFAGLMLPAVAAKILNCAAAFIVGVMSDAAQLGAGVWSGAVRFELPSLVAAYAAVFAFLGAAAAFRGNFARFVLAPALSVSIMLAVKFANG